MDCYSKNLILFHLAWLIVKEKNLLQIVEVLVVMPELVEKAYEYFYNAPKAGNITIDNNTHKSIYFLF